MDYKGQQLSELLFYYITIIFGSIGWIVGYWNQDFSYVFYPWLAGVVLSTIVSSGRKKKLRRTCYKYIYNDVDLLKFRFVFNSSSFM